MRSQFVRYCLCFIGIVIGGSLACSDNPIAPTRPPGVASDVVSPLPPEGDMVLAVAEQIYAPSNIVAGDSVERGPYPRDLIWIFFQEDASQAARQAAIDSIGGEVVGGHRYNNGGVYYVRIQQDGTAGPLHRAIDKLKSLPQVRSATPDLELGLQLNYAQPADGIGWGVGDWRFNPVNAGSNWGLETIEAPMAWGCTVGDPSVTVGVADRGFYSVDDLAPNVSAADYSPAAAIPHGTAVASVIAARGSNGIGMAGVMWFAGLRLSDYGLSTYSPAGFRSFIVLDSLAKAGAQIINYSSGLGWLEAANNPHLPTGTADEIRQATDLGIVMHEVIASNPNTLFVLAAGNDGIDAWWSGVTQAADSADVADRILVVAGIDRSGGYFVGPTPLVSNRNIAHSLVTIAAPAADIGTLDSTSVAHMMTWTGTSFAAPFVTGVAGLLKAFDPSLTAAQIRTYILLGASDGGKSVSGVPILNAYTALKRAAQQNGAPLCGNRIWARNGSIYAQRGGTTAEAIATPVSGVVQVIPHEDGHVLEYLGNDWSNRALQWQPSNRTWIDVPDNLASRPAGSYQSINGESNRPDTTSGISVYNRDPDWGEVDNAYVVGVAWGDTLGNNGSASFELPMAPFLPSGHQQRSADIGAYSMAFPQHGGPIVVTITWNTYTAVNVISSQHTDLYAIDMQSKSVQLNRTLPNTSIFWTAYNEDDSELVYAGGIAHSSYASYWIESCSFHFADPTGTDRFVTPADSGACEAMPPNGAVAANRLVWPGPARLVSSSRGFINPAKPRVIGFPLRTTAVPSFNTRVRGSSGVGSISGTRPVRVRQRTSPPSDGPKPS